MIRIGVCDEDAVFLKSVGDCVCNAFSEHTSDFAVERFTSGEELVREHEKERFDILFLDIDMPGMSGFDVASRLREDFFGCFIIFVTSHSELVYESMDFQPFHFIRKSCNVPLDESIRSIAKKLMKHMKQKQKIILEDFLGRRKDVYIKDIIYIESDRHYVYYHVAGQAEPLRMRESIADCEARYSDHDLVRIHKSYIINLRYVSFLDIGASEVTLGSAGVTLPIGKSNKNMLDQRYTFYLRTKA